MNAHASIDELRVASALAGEAIYGDDFSAAEIEQWFKDEQHGYSSLDHEDAQTRLYAYRALDARYAWRHLPAQIDRAMGLGSAFGLEFESLAGRVRSLSIVEPETSFWSDSIAGIPTRYHMPRPDGRLDFDDQSFDLVTAFGVLHHIPNVGAVMGELARVLRPGGHLILREPIVSMGDWRQPRRGLTARERGLPLGCMPALLQRCGLQVVSHHQLGFGPLLKVATRVYGGKVWNSAWYTRVDQVFSTAFQWNYRYHRTTLWQRFAPTFAMWVLTRAA